MCALCVHNLRTRFLDSRVVESSDLLQTFGDPAVPWWVCRCVERQLPGQGRCSKGLESIRNKRLQEDKKSEQLPMRRASPNWPRLIVPCAAVLSGGGYMADFSSPKRAAIDRRNDGGKAFRDGLGVDEQWKYHRVSEGQ